MFSKRARFGDFVVDFDAAPVPEDPEPATAEEMAEQFGAELRVRGVA